MQKYLPKHLAKKTIALQSLLPKKTKTDWRGKPASWPDIRKNAQDGHIYLLCDTRYPIGLIASATGGYSVKIDGTLYANYASNAQFSMADWAEYTDTEGYDISEPTGAIKAHIIEIYPQTENENIFTFHCERISENEIEQQGILWTHFNISNSINLANAFYKVNSYKNEVLQAITAKHNKLPISSLFSSFSDCYNLTYVPLLYRDTTSFVNLSSSFANCRTLKAISLKNIRSNYTIGTFLSCYNLEKLILLNCDFTSSDRFDTFITNARNLRNFYLDLSECSLNRRITCFSTSVNFMSGFKGLRVSNQAPFDFITPPQISVSHTGMDRTALVQLFNDLPTVTDGQIINIIGCSGTANLTDDDKKIATEKGWTIAE